MGLRSTTADPEVRRIFEPKAPPIEERVRALGKLHSAGVKAFVMIAPLLPGAEGLATKLSGKVDYALIDKMNYHYADWVYKKHGLEYAMSDQFFAQTKAALTKALEREGIPFQILF